jgi:hypothetical protein
VADHKVIAEPERSSGANEGVKMETRIVVLQRGWVVVGNFAQDGEEVVVTKAKVIRRWGTTKGLGELVDGPKENTVLDPAGEVRANKLAVVLTVQCNPEAWANEM